MRRLRSICWVAVLAVGPWACTAKSGADGGTGTDGGPVRSPDGGLAAVAPVLSAATAQVSGRAGKDLRVGIEGQDQNLDVSSVWVKLLDSQGQPVIGLDTDRDLVPDSAEGRLDLDGLKWVGERVTGSVVIRGLFNLAQPVAQVEVSLQDATNLRSSPLTVAVLDQPVRAMGQSCDPAFIADRCPPGVGCRGTPAVCQEGLAPEITRLAFYKATGGPLILIEGTEPEDDLSTIRFAFQSLQGAAVSIDSDGNGTPDLASFDLDVTGQSVDGKFFIRMQAGEGLDLQVPKLTAEASDHAGHTGLLKSASPTAVPVRSAGQACDPRGFDACASALVCSPGFVGQANHCEASSTLHTAQCKAAPVLVPTAEGATAFGRAEGVSLWDAPAGCSTNDPKGRPEGLVTVRLTERANTLTLTTAKPGTNFDTTMYFLSGCPADSSAAFGCSDDAPGAAGASTLVLHDLPAGDYLVVVDSFDFVGGSFELSATVQ